MKGATPPKQNQGTNVRQQKIKNKMKFYFPIILSMLILPGPKSKMAM